MSVLKIKDQNNDWIQIPTIKGDKGDPFTYADFTPKQLESLKGKDGISPTVSVASDTSEDYRLSFTDETHTVTTPNLIPEAEKIFDVYPHDTASGSIASFSDGADGIPLKSCIVQVEPVQDLHGYDSPWPAGGGKNLFQTTAVTTTVDGVTFTVNSDGSIKTTGTPTANISTFIFGKQTLPSGEYIANGFANGANSGTRMTVFNESTGAVLAIIYNGNDGTFTLTEESVVRVYPIILTDSYESGWTFYPMIRKATEEDATFAPYSNECPISGWTGCEVQRTGVNVWDEEWELGDFNENGEPKASLLRLRSKDFVPIVPNTTYFFAFADGVYSGTWFRVFFYDINKEFVSVTAPYKNEAVTIPNNVKYLKFSTSDTWGGVEYTGGISINYPSTDHDYHLYTGQTYPITFPSEAGTVYGGYIDPINGELVVDGVIVDLETFTPSVRYEGDVNKTISITLPETYIGYGASRGFFCSTYAVNGGVSSASDLKTPDDKDVGIYLYSNFTKPKTKTVYFVIPKDLALSGELVFFTTEPQTYPLTPTEIKTLLGTNNIWADTGNTEVTYRADTALYIKRLTESDTDMIADSNIVSGQYFMVGTDLYKATVNIASGASVIVGTNATKVSLATALNEINQ